MSSGGVTCPFCVRMHLLFIFSVNMCSKISLLELLTLVLVWQHFAHRNFFVFFLSSACCQRQVTTKSDKTPIKAPWRRVIAYRACFYLPCVCTCKMLALWHLTVRVHNFSYRTYRQGSSGVRIPPFECRGHSGFTIVHSAIIQ